MPICVTRLSDEPIIHPGMDNHLANHMDTSMGENICGPAIIRVPDWIASPLGRYYLYFAHHKGRYIRMAYADSLTGPWCVHEAGVLDLDRSLFPTEPPALTGAAEDPVTKAPKDNYAHIASPDVHIDQAGRQIRMYYHGLLETGDQGTRVAYSTDGLVFHPREPVLGPPYFRVFHHRDHCYTVTWGGALWRSTGWDQPFEHCDRLVPFEGAGEEANEEQMIFRHGEAHVIGDRLHLFYSRIGDCPEQILYRTIDLAPDWRDWKVGEAVPVLAPERAWEGGDLPLATSRIGWAPTRLRELRDPCLFVDEDGQSYLLYCGAGEAGIGIARIEGL
jgi:hypothetical protein